MMSSKRQKIDTQSSLGDTVKLIVGGSFFVTTVGTLVKYESMLKAMFSGNHEIKTDHEGEFE